MVDLCAASGLFASAMRDEGFPVVRGFELEKARAACWFQNVGAPCEVRDVMTLTATELREYADRDGRLVVIGGIPCQDFSTANLQKREDTVLRDHLLELVEVVGPTACALENIRNAWKGVRGVSYVRDCDVGGLTIRERGFYGAPPIPATHAERPQRRLDGATLPAWRGWGEAVPGFNFAADFTQKDDWENRLSLQVRPASVPFWTVTTKTDSNVVIWQRGRRKSLRWLDTMESAALQGFPAGWIFPKGLEATRGCIGDAVPYAMGRAVARALKAQVEAVAS